MSLYELQDSLLHNHKSISYEAMQKLPFFRFQIMCKNFEKLIKEEKKRNGQSTGSSSLPSYGQLMGSSNSAINSLKKR